MKSYIVKQKDLDSRMLSRSGGIFAAISDQVLAQGGVIYGAGMDKNFNVVHKRAVNATERDELRGSKYVQSDTVIYSLTDINDGLPDSVKGQPSYAECNRRDSFNKTLLSNGFYKENLIDLEDRI